MEIHKILPCRIRVGAITDSALVLALSHEERKKILWQDIEFLALGYIKELKGIGDLPQSTMRKMLQSMVTGEEVVEKPQTKEYREIYLLDIFVAGQPYPYRLDSVCIDYRSFLGQVEYISKNNFKKLARAIARKAVNSRFNIALVHFLTNRYFEMPKYPALHDYEYELDSLRKNLSAQIPQREVNFEDQP